MCLSIATRNCCPSFAQMNLKMNMVKYILFQKGSTKTLWNLFSLFSDSYAGAIGMTAYTYGYNLNGIMSFKSSNLVSRSQTNVNSITDVAGDLDALAADSLPKRSDNSSIYKLVPWVANLPQL